MKYVLIGSLGNITKPLAQSLIAAGQDVTIVTSSADREAQITALGAKAAVGSVEDVPFLTKTFTGADAIYTMVPPKMDAPNWKEYIHQIGKNYAAAIKASGVKKVVQLSSIGSHLASGAGPVSAIHFVEQELNALDNVDVKILRPGNFYTNLYTSIGMIKHAGILGNNYGADTMIPMAHPNDIAAVAADLLLHPQFTGKSIQYIVSDERNSKEIAKVIGTAIGKPDLPYVPFSDEDALQGAIKAGVPEDPAKNFVEMGAAIRSGEMMADYKKQGGTAQGKTKLEDFAKEFAVTYAAPEKAEH
jgi:uncharacterized protein YbjT (DUF2867 family)